MGMRELILLLLPLPPPPPPPPPPHLASSSSSSSSSSRPFTPSRARYLQEFGKAFGDAGGLALDADRGGPDVDAAVDVDEGEIDVDRVRVGSAVRRHHRQTAQLLIREITYTERREGKN